MSFAQFYTNEIVSEHLVSLMKSKSPANILDIGCGEASLLLAAGKRWKSANLIGFDIDPNNIKSFNKKLQLDTGDGLDPDLSKKILDLFGPIDIAVSNPPYLSINFERRAKNILSEAGLSDVISKKMKVIPAELVFLAQNLLVMKKAGELGVILPAGFISGERWKPLREFIISEYSINSCVQLPNDAFKNTEASTFALYLKNEKNESKKIKLHQLGHEKIQLIDDESAIDRMDYSYYSYMSSDQSDKNVFNQFELNEIFRGNVSEANLSCSGIKYLHTSDLNEDYKLLSSRYYSISDDMRYAEKGDILIARVGSRCVGNFGYVEYGRLPISDCVFVLRSTDNLKLWQLIKANNIGDRLKSSSLGVGAKYITKKMLKDIFNG